MKLCDRARLSRNRRFGGKFKHGPALHPEEAEGEGEGGPAPHAVSSNTPVTSSYISLST